MGRRQTAQTIRQQIADGVGEIARQYAVIRKLSEIGHATHEAELTLYDLERLQLRRLARLRRLTNIGRASDPASGQPEVLGAY